MANVLIVEDSKSAAAAHAYSLWEFGHTVTFAYSAKEARDCFQSTHHEVVLLDFDLPDGTGLDVFRSLRQVDPTVCVVMVTGKGNECLAAQILKEGAKDYLTKSSELLNLLPDVVDRVLKEKKTRAKLLAKDRELKEAHARLEQKVAELANANENLQEEISQRVLTAAALEESNDKLQSALDELKRSQAQVFQSEKMASVGQLAAGIAHEINNPTGFISSNLFTLATYMGEIQKVATAFREMRNLLHQNEVFKSLPLELRERCEALAELEQQTEVAYLLDDGIELIKESQDGAKRIQNIVGDLKNFAHPGKKEMEFIDINAIIESAINLVWHEIKYKASVDKDFAELPLVPCYPQMIGQIFMNLLVNAAQAMENDGTITIRTSAESDQVVIRVQDTGKGISPEHRSKIFDPFFTTKEVGQGTGLGLKVVYDIVEKHGGRIQVDSTPDVGTEFTIHLPIEQMDQQIARPQ